MVEKSCKKNATEPFVMWNELAAIHIITYLNVLYIKLPKCNLMFFHGFCCSHIKQQHALTHTEVWRQRMNTCKHDDEIKTWNILLLHVIVPFWKIGIFTIYLRNNLFYRSNMIALLQIIEMSQYFCQPICFTWYS